MLFQKNESTTCLLCKAQARWAPRAHKKGGAKWPRPLGAVKATRRWMTPALGRRRVRVLLGRHRERGHVNRVAVEFAFHGDRVAFVACGLILRVQNVHFLRGRI